MKMNLKSLITLIIVVFLSLAFAYVVVRNLDEESICRYKYRC